MLSSEKVHASCVAKGDRAVLLAGPSGAGKSDLALRLIDRGWSLVSDDYTLLSKDKDCLVASPPPTIAGKMEVRGLGIVEKDFVERAHIALLVNLDEEMERLPLDQARATYLGIDIPALTIVSRAASAPILVELALERCA